MGTWVLELVLVFVLLTLCRVVSHACRDDTVRAIISQSDLIQEDQKRRDTHRCDHIPCGDEDHAEYDDTFEDSGRHDLFMGGGYVRHDESRPDVDQ